MSGGRGGGQGQDIAEVVPSHQMKRNSASEMCQTKFLESLEACLITIVTVHQKVAGR